MNFKKLVYSSGFTLFETVIALTIFVIVIVGGNVLLHTLSQGVVEMQNMLQSEMLSRNGAILAKDIFTHEGELEWGAHKALLLGDPKEATFQLALSGDSYVLMNSSEYEGPINVYASAVTEATSTKFYRKIRLVEKEGWGLYELESTACFDTCEYSSKSYEIFQRNE